MTDIVVGDTGLRDELRSFLRAGVTIPDDEIQACTDAAVDATAPWIRPGFTMSAPPGVVQFVLNVAAHIWRVRDTGGETQVAADGTFSTGTFITSTLVRRYAVLGGDQVRTPRTVA